MPRVAAGGLAARRGADDGEVGEWWDGCAAQRVAAGGLAATRGAEYRAPQHVLCCVLRTPYCRTVQISHNSAGGPIPRF